MEKKDISPTYISQMLDNAKKTGIKVAVDIFFSASDIDEGIRNNIIDIYNKNPDPAHEIYVFLTK